MRSPFALSVAMAGVGFWPDIIVHEEDLPLIYSDVLSGFWYLPVENVTELNSAIEKLRLAVIEDSFTRQWQVHLDPPVAISSDLGNNTASTLLEDDWAVYHAFPPVCPGLTVTRDEHGLGSFRQFAQAVLPLMPTPPSLPLPAPPLPQPPPPQPPPPPRQLLLPRKRAAPPPPSHAPPLEMQPPTAAADAADRHTKVWRPSFSFYLIGDRSFANEVSNEPLTQEEFYEDPEQPPLPPWRRDNS